MPGGVKADEATAQPSRENEAAMPENETPAAVSADNDDSTALPSAASAEILLLGLLLIQIPV